MNSTEKKMLEKEAEMQLKALKKINIWKTIAIAISTIGVAVIYAGINSAANTFSLCIPGVIMLALGVFSALILNLGLKNGRKNVEKILNIIE